MNPDFVKLPDPPTRDPHDRGVLLIVILISICTAILIYGMVSHP